MTVRLFFQGLLVVVLIVVVGFFLFFPSRVDLTEPSREEVSNAMAFLQSSLHNPRFQYMDFLAANTDLRGQTHEFMQEIIQEAEINEDDYVIYTIDVPTTGLYSLMLEYDLPPETVTNLTVSIRINGERQFDEAATIVLPVFWQDESKIFPVNRFGDEVIPSQTRLPGPHRVKLYDAGFGTAQPLLFRLEAGTNTIEVRNETSRVLRVGNMTVYSERVLPAYTPPTGRTSGELIYINATDYTYKNSAFVQLQGLRNVSLYPFHPVDRVINVANMSRAGDEIFFDLDIPETGYYAITLHAITAQDDFSTFVSVRINGEIPFAEAAAFALVPHADERWRNQIIADTNGEPIWFYLEQGTHELSVRLELDPIALQLSQLRLLTDHINQLALEIRRVTGREIDRNRTWRLTRYIPNLAYYLDAYDVIFRDIVSQLGYFSPRGDNSSVANSIITAISLNNRLRERPDELPLMMSMINGPYASILQMVGVSMDGLVDVGMTLNFIYVGRAHDLPRERAPRVQSLSAGVQHLWATYTSDKFVVRNYEDALNVWVNYSYLHVDILQQMIDTRFTYETGIQVNISAMPDVGRLILSRAAGTNPDVAIGVPAFMPFEMGARGALYDLSRFEDFWYVMGDFVPGTLIPYIFNDSVFAVPETIGFAATVYRTDILGPLGLSAPDTWDDVAAMQSVLQRFDMSFFKPIASGVGYKWFFQTSPLIYQHGGYLFSQDGLSTGINQPESVQALTFLGDLFTTFALDEQVPAFFNAFRFGQNPVGIMDAGTYMLLLYAAPELLGQWNIAPFPGTMQDDGTIRRDFIANGAGSIMFDNTNMAEEGWKFLKWYLSEETQRDFAFSLFSNFRILWLSANMDALAQTPIEYNHLRVILDSMQWLRDVPRSPGQYMLERRLSDIWNTMVFEGTPAQVAIDIRVIEINREFRRKMMEFGFIDSDGNQLQPYVVRELDWVHEQIENARQPVR